LCVLFVEMLKTKTVM